VPSLDPALPVVKLQSMEDVFRQWAVRACRRSRSGSSACLALLLAAIGNYGVLS